MEATEYGLVVWVKESGCAEADATYLMSLQGCCGGIAWRKRERRRLALIYGDGYRMNVERSEGGEVAPSPEPVGPRNGGRADALALLAGRNQKHGRT